MPTLYAAAWLIISGGGYNWGGGVTAIPMPSMQFCQQELAQLHVTNAQTDRDKQCIAGKDTRVTTP